MIQKHEHYDKQVWTQAAYLNQHKDICMCHQGCPKFKPNTEDNCPIAQASFELSKQVGIVLVHSCDQYEPPVGEA